MEVKGDIMAKTIEEIKSNLHQDINNANSKEIDKIYFALKDVLKKFDRDSLVKNLGDFFKGFLKSKRSKCIQFVNDIFDSKDRLSKEEKDGLRKALLDISNIHRTFIENIIELLGAN